MKRPAKLWKMWAMSKEIWKTVPGFNGKYQASNIGRVRSLWFRHGMRKIPKLMTPCLHHKGYKRVCLSKDGKAKSYSIHRLVLISFKGEKNGFQVAHNNGIRIDNRIENLRWVTPRENSLDRIKHNNSGQKLNRYYVLKIRSAFKLGYATRILAKNFNVTKQTIRGVVSRKYWSHVK